MTDSFVTQCPNCQTSFRVNHGQLSVARGAVRCGSCLHVFNAARQLLEQSTARQNAPLVAMPAAPANAPRTTPAAERQWPAAHEVDLDTLDLATPARLDTLSAQRDDGSLEPTHWPEALYGAPDEQDREQAPLVLQTVVAAEPAPPQSRAEPARAEPSLRHEPLLDDLLEDPPHYTWEKTTTPLGKRLLWTLLSVAAALLLMVQYMVYQFDALARQDAYRPWFEQMCPYLGCAVPAKVDIALIKSSNLVVRSHPEFSGALVVDAIIYNRAAFAQPFPQLELRFADLNGGLIASRRFKPGEYLGGDLASQAQMPPQTPIHIALDILDPGPKAVNYSLSFRSPE
jgi:predicted Zn finger-like uncharacterized protein